MAAEERQDLPVAGIEVLGGSPSEGLEALPEPDHPFHPPQQRIRVVLEGLHVECLVVVLGIDDEGQVELLGICPGEPGVAIGAPLHRSTHRIPIPEIDVLPHPDLVAVVDDGSPGHRQEQPIQELDLAAIVVEKRRKPAPDSEVDSGFRVGGVHAVHVVPLLVRHHFQCQLIVVAEKECPLAVLRNPWRLPQDVHQGEAIRHPQ